MVVVSRGSGYFELMTESEMAQERQAEREAERDRQREREGMNARGGTGEQGGKDEEGRGRSRAGAVEEEPHACATKKKKESCTARYSVYLLYVLLQQYKY